MKLLLLLLLGDAATLTLEASERDRRCVLAEAEVRLAPPFRLKEKQSGKVVPCQASVSGGKTRVLWLVRELPAREKRVYTLESSPAGKTDGGLSIADDLSILAGGKRITRYHPGTDGKKPFFYPLVADGVNIARSYPIEEPRAGEPKDHPHHTGLFHAHGKVNGKDYWHKEIIRHTRLLHREAGPVCARLVSENHWGDHLVETQDVMIFSVDDETVMDWTITLKPQKGTVTLGKTKEGTFALRVTAGLKTLADANGNKGEPAIRKDNAPWVHYSGKVEGKKVGVAIMNHPSSFRYPTTWHVRAYGLFAANPYYVKGEHKLDKGGSITLGYRVYAHGGEGKVAEVFAGYTENRVSVK